MGGISKIDLEFELGSKRQYNIYIMIINRYVYIIRILCTEV